jgi:antitoxin component of MazEF toxin-antitoxin module
MEKHLVPFGNSLGIVIDRPICKLLRLTRNTPLKITTDGRRIVIEPVDAPAILPAEQLDVVRVVYTVADSMPFELHEQLHPAITGRRSCVTALIWARRVMADPQPGDELFVRRYQRCLDAKRAGVSWEAAVATAINDVPVPEEVLERARTRLSYD